MKEEIKGCKDCKHILNCLKDFMESAQTCLNFSKVKTKQNSYDVLIKKAKEEGIKELLISKQVKIGELAYYLKKQNNYIQQLEQTIVNLKQKLKQGKE